MKRTALFLALALILAGCAEVPAQSAPGSSAAVSAVAPSIETKPSSKAGPFSTGETPEQAVKNAFKAIKDLDKEKAEKYFIYTDLFGNSEGIITPNGEKAQKLFVKNLAAKVDSSSISGEFATVKAEISNTDMRPIILDVFENHVWASFENSSLGENALTAEELSEKALQNFIELFAQRESDIRKTEVNIILSKNNDSWKINMGETLQDAILGGMLSTNKEITESIEAYNSK